MFFNLIKELNRLGLEINKLLNVFIRIKEMNRLTKEINRLLNKEMSNIQLKITIETFSKLRLLGLKNMPPGQFWRAPAHADIIEF